MVLVVEGIDWHITAGSSCWAWRRPPRRRPGRACPRRCGAPKRHQGSGSERGAQESGAPLKGMAGKMYTVLVPELPGPCIGSRGFVLLCFGLAAVNVMLFDSACISVGSTSTEASTWPGGQED